MPDNSFRVETYDRSDPLVRAGLLNRADEIKAITDEAFYKHRDKETDIEDVHRALLEAPVIVMAYCNTTDGILGFSVGVEVAHFTGFELFYHDVVTVPAVQGKGVQTKIMTAMSTFADLRRVKRDMLYTETDNTAASGFYKSKGFTERPVSTILYIRERRS